MEMTLFDLAKKLSRDQAFVLNLNRVVEKVVAGQCICQEAISHRHAFKCPIHH
jgi:hypothetical protein